MSFLVLASDLVGGHGGAADGQSHLLPLSHDCHNGILEGAFKLRISLHYTGAQWVESLTLFRRSESLISSSGHRFMSKTLVEIHNFGFQVV